MNARRMAIPELFLLVLATVSVACASPTVAPAVSASPTAASATSALPPTAAPATSAPPTTAASATKASTASPASTQKPLVIVINRELAGLGGPTQPGVAGFQVTGAVFTRLAMVNDKLQSVPGVAEELPSQQKGTWVVNPDGSMVTTWHIRKGVKWHDGVELTAQDYIFAHEAMSDPKVPSASKTTLQLIDKMEAPDPYTLVVRWKSFHPFADQWVGLDDLDALPRHILEKVYREDVQKFVKSPYWVGTGFVGNGPYKVVQVVPGSQIELKANEDYFLGKPKIDRVIFKYILDTDAINANILSGAVDVAVGVLEFSAEQAKSLAKEKPNEWQVIYTPALGLDHLSLKLDHPFLRNVDFRRGLMYAIDRQLLVDTVFAGAGVVAQSYASPRDPIMAPDADNFIVKYDYDPKKAADSFAKAGLTKGSDGILRNGAGEKASFELMVKCEDKTWVQAQAVLQDMWKKAGIDVVSDCRSRKAADFREYLFQRLWKGMYEIAFGASPFALPDVDWHSSQIPTAANGWSGSNVAGWSNAQADALMDKISSARTLQERQQLNDQLLKIWTSEVPVIPISFPSRITVAKQGLCCLKPTGTYFPDTWNIWEWYWK